MNLLKALATVGGMTMLSRILGFVRDAVMARIFGAGMMTDAFFVAFKIPNLLRRIFAEGAFSQAFVPILAEYRARGSEEEVRSLIDHVSSMLAVVLAAVSVLGMLAAPFIVLLTAPGFGAEPAKFALTVDLLRVTLPYILLISLASLLGGILNSYRIFSAPAFSPTLLNVAFIGFSLVLVPYFDPPVATLAWAVIAGGLLQLLYLAWHVGRKGLLPRWRWNSGHAGMRRVLRQMGPAIFGVSVSQISLLINTIIASFLTTGAVSWLYYADRLMEFPTGILGVALGTILLPSLSRTYTLDDRAEYQRLLDWGLRLTLMLALPAAAALALLSEPLIAALFQYGRFSEHDALMSAQALTAYGVGLLGLILIKVLAPGFYARQDIRTPVRIAIISLGVTQLANLLLVPVLQHVGLALSISLGALLNAGLLYLALVRQDIFRPQPGWGRFLAAVVMATSAMALLLGLLIPESGAFARLDMGGRILGLGGLVAAGGGLYFVVLWLAGIRPRDFRRQAV